MADGMTIKGLKETQREMERVVRELRGGGVLTAMRKATLIVQASAKRKAPVDTGRLRASITPEIRMTPGSGIKGVVGSIVKYAPHREFPTRPHFVPGAYIGAWAGRHGFKKGSGLKVSGKATPYLYPAFDENKDRIAKILSDAVAEIVK